jgi:hypothetical protein
MIDVIGKFGSFVRSKATPIEMILVVFILLSYAPLELLGQQNATLKRYIDMIGIHNIMRNSFVRLFLWLVLFWAYFYAKDMKLFFIVALYFASR